MSVVKNTVLYTETSARRIDLMLSVPIIHTQNNRKCTLRGDGYVYGIDCGDGFMGVY